MRDFALAYGRGFIEYTLFIRDCDSGSITFPFFFSTTMDAVSNIIYNISYIFSIPSKFIYALKYNLFDRVSPIKYGVSFSIFDMFLGFILALLMLFFGTVIGFICHPIYSITNLSIYIFGSLYDLLWGSMIKPIIDIFLFIFI